MSGGTTEIHRDSDYLAYGKHRGADSATTLWAGDYFAKQSLDLESSGVSDDLYIENDTAGTNSLTKTVTGDKVTTDDDITWDNGDVFYIYKTATKNQQISTVWTDLSRGWKTDPDEMQDGWRADDVDLDRENPGRVFGPGQPEPI